MEKEPYNIDDILSEVKKRREEDSPQKETKEETFHLETQEEPAKQKEDKAEFSIDIQDESPTVQMQFVEEDKNPQQKADRETEPQEEAPAGNEGAVNEDPQETTVVHLQAEEEKQTGSDDPDAMVDLFALADQIDKPAEEETPEKKEAWRKTKKGKIIISVICVLLVLIVGVAAFGILYANDLLNKVTGNENSELYQKESTYNDMDFLQEDFPAIEELSADQITSYKEYLKQWYENGDPVSSTHVLNILLVGEDTREEEISDTSRADSAIIVSVNVDTGTITLTSILRDLYVYFEIDGEGQYGKINSAASLGGMKTYIRTVERYYKVQIDNYVVVNFATFPEIVDMLGGVTITMTSAEIKEINTHPKRYGNITIEQTFEGSEGEITLGGEQALAYCRIRKIDSDGARANRQKTVLLALFDNAKNSSITNVAKVVNNLIEYVYTGYSKKELISVGKYALTEGWLNYNTVTTTVPSADNSKGGNFKTGTGAYRYGGWVWKSDIPADAYDLQMLIYGKSNITLAEDRADYVNID